MFYANLDNAFESLRKNIQMHKKILEWSIPYLSELFLMEESMKVVVQYPFDLFRLVPKILKMNVQITRVKLVRSHLFFFFIKNSCVSFCVQCCCNGTTKTRWISKHKFPTSLIIQIVLKILQRTTTMALSESKSRSVTNFASVRAILHIDPQILMVPNTFNTQIFPIWGWFGVSSSWFNEKSFWYFTFTRQY